MTREELIKELEELRDIENYSQSELMNTGYKTGLLDALDLVNKYFSLAPVSGRSEQLKAFVEFYNNRQNSYKRIYYDEIDIYLESL